jgi:hypothetical protein
MPGSNVYLFQYGSNMSTKRLNSTNRLEGCAKPIGKARLDGWGIRFDLYSESNDCAVTDIIRSHQEFVWGVLFLVPRELVIARRGERSRMDVVEGAGLGSLSNYRRATIYVRRGKYLMQAETYLGTSEARRRFEALQPNAQRVSREYFGYVAVGCKSHKLPKSYLAKIKKQAGRLK